MTPSIQNFQEHIVYRLLQPCLKVSSRLLDSFPVTFICLCAIFLPLGIGLVFSVTYIVTFLYGLFCGHTLPTREIFLLFPALGPIFSQPPSIAKAFFVYAFVGFLLSFVLLRKGQPELCRTILAALGRNWSTLSCLIIFCLLLATLGEVYFSYTSRNGTLAGIIPYSDSNGHYSHYTKYFYDGVMGDWVLRRPIAAFMGATIHWLAGNDPATALLLRCLLVSFAIWASCAVMNKSFGVWSAVACLALEYAYIYNYLHTFLTESLGFFWGCIAVTLWLQALRENCLFWNLAAFSVTLIGLLTRMGAMFLVPALFLYVLWRGRELYPGHGWWKKPLLGLCFCTAAIVLLNATFASRGAGDKQETGSNFSYSFVGLTLGTNWKGAQQHYITEIRSLKDEKQKSRFLYQQGIKNILNSPDVFFTRLAHGEREFLKRINFFLFRNWYLFYFVGCLLILRYKTLFSKSSGPFWILIWGATLLSIPFVYFDSSWRINIFVYPFIACFFSLPLAQTQPRTEFYGWRTAGAPLWLTILLVGSLLLLMVSVALFPRFHTSANIEQIQTYIASQPQLPTNILVGADGMGFLVVPDGEELDTTVPSIPWTTFIDTFGKFVRTTGEVVLPDGFPKPPFVVLDQIPVIGSPAAYGYFIVPPNVLHQKNVLLWDFEIAETVRDKYVKIPWKIVSKAIPVLYK